MPNTSRQNDFIDIGKGEFARNPIAVISKIDNATFGISNVTIDGVHCVYLNDPALIRAVLATQWQQFRKEFGYKKSRTLIQSDMFSPSIVWPTPQEFTSVLVQLRSIVSEFIYRTGSQVDDLYSWCRQLTMEIFVRTLLKGCIPANVSQAELEAATIRTIDLLGRIILKFPENIDCADDEDGDAHNELRHYARFFQQHCTDIHATTGRAMTTILAGYEQMASIMYWMIVHFAERPLREMPYVTKKQYVDEVIRLHSPIWTIMRRPKYNVHITDNVLPIQSVVITSPWLMARNERYFWEPDMFRPERWKAPIETFAFFPFSHGPRACKGEVFVRATLHALLNELEHKAPVLCKTAQCLHVVKVSAVPAQTLQVNFR